MQTNTINKVLGITAASICTVFAVGQSAQAFGFTSLNTDWRIVQDSSKDGTGYGGKLGSFSEFEMFGMAAKVEDGQAYFAFNGNLGLEKRGGVGQGDLFFNFSGESFKDASAQEKLFAVHFAPNDAGNGNLEYGLYSNVKAKSVTRNNYGHPGFQSYRNYVANKGGEVGFGDLTPQEAQEYLTAFYGGYEDGNHSIQNVIDTGTKVADDGFSLLSPAELDAVGFGNYSSKAKTFGFKFDASKLPEDKALISLLQECINDGMAMAVNFDDNDPGIEVPEPSSIVSLSLIGLALAGIRKKSNQ